MGTKTISLDDEAYNRLKRQKKNKESFSDVVKRLTPPENSKSLIEFAGVWNLNEEELSLLKNRIEKLGRDFDDMFGQ